MDNSGEGFIDRSKVRILLCDNDAKSSEEVFTLLCRCSYEVTSVRSPRQVIDALNAEGPDIDIILSEVDLPMSKGFKLLKYIMRDKDLRRIPVIMMSAQDEMSIVVKCLKHGAADYLVKPLRTNELLNLWTHVWRRRRMLGLAEKNICNYDFDMVMSDPSDANTNSTILLSDDTDDKSTHQEEEVSVTTAHASAPVETLATPDVPGISDRRTVSGQILSCPMKSELKIGESSAFFTYVKSGAPNSNPEGVISNNGNIPHLLPADYMFDASRGPAYYIPGTMNQMMVPSSSQLYQESMSNLNNHVNSAMAPQYGHVPQCLPHMPGMSSFPYHPVSVCLEPGQMPMPMRHPWPSYGSPASNEAQGSKITRREAALMKFRQKRKERCFDKKIRYENRKQLAERRPRVKGQFVRKGNCKTVDLNGLPASAVEDDEEEEEYYEEDMAATTNINSSPEPDFVCRQ